MRRPTSNIIPFPAILPEQVPTTSFMASQSKRLAKLLDATSQDTAFRSQAIPQAIALCAATAPSLPDPVIVAQVVIGFARRKGIAMSSIPKTFREQLLVLWAAGDPTALMLRDWLEGNRKLLTKNGVPEPSEVHGNGEAV